MSLKRHGSIQNRRLEADEAAVIVQTRGRPPLIVSGPGVVRTFWRWRRIIFVDLKPLTLSISADAMTKDGVRVRARADVQARVVSPADAATKVVDYAQATCQITEAALRRVLQGHLSRALVERRPDVEAELLGKIGTAVESWGMSVSDVRIQLVE